VSFCAQSANKVNHLLLIDGVCLCHGQLERRLVALDGSGLSGIPKLTFPASDWLEGVEFDLKLATNGEKEAVAPAADGTHDWDGADRMIRAAFRGVDGDKDGKINAAEIKKLLGALSGDHAEHSDEDVQLLLKQIDKDGDGMVTESEFVNKIMTSSEGEFLAALSSFSPGPG
jgi:hypothetical protein